MGEQKENKNAMLSAIQSFKTLEHQILNESEKKAEKVHKLGKLLPFERLHALLDNKESFIPLCSLAGNGMYDDEQDGPSGGGLITGIGIVAGVRCAIMVNNYTIKGGTISPSGLQKTLRLQEIALANKLPVIHLLESGGANLNYASEVFVWGAKTFATQARLSAAGIPQIVVVHGNATAGGAYQPGLSDMVVLVEDKSQMFLAGPALVKAAIGQSIDAESLGGSKVHAKITGSGEYLAQDDKEAIELVKDLVGQFKNIFHVCAKGDQFTEPAGDVESLLELIPKNPKKVYDIRDLLAFIVDHESLQEYKEQFDPFTICHFATIGGFKVGIIGNNGPITDKGAAKATQFIQFCSQLDIPLIFLHNTTGFMVGGQSEHSGIIKQGSKMIQAVTNADVPKISIVIGGSYGAGNYAMGGRGLDPDFIFAWPNSRTAVMGGHQAADVLAMVTKAKMKSLGKEVDEDRLAGQKKKIIDQFDHESSALFGTARLWDDGLIDPRDTRKVLIELLKIKKEVPLKKTKKNNFGLARF